jgi:hypothetical protein
MTSFLSKLCLLVRFLNFKNTFPGFEPLYFGSGLMFRNGNMDILEGAKGQTLKRHWLRLA